MQTVALYLMNRKGWSVLNAVIEKFGPGVLKGVVTSRDAAMVKDYYDEIISLCKINEIPVYDRTNQQIPGAEIKIAIGWRWIIQDDKNLIVLHDSLLPRYRGFAPLVNALINGETLTGVTSLYATSEYDKGDIIGQLKINLSYPLKINDAIEQVSSLYEKLVIEIFENIVAGKKTLAIAQDENNATYSLWREDDDYAINWQHDATYIKRFIDAVGFPFKGASALTDGKKIRITDATVISDVKIENRDPGKIIFIREGKPVIVCGSGLLYINEMTDESGKSLLPLNKFRLRFY